MIGEDLPVAQISIFQGNTWFVWVINNDEAPVSDHTLAPARLTLWYVGGTGTTHLI